ncbi:DNA N-6-adenine-methyltransferase [Microbacterium sp. NPDC079995]|uniref:DNA N-6-adenine-methyltransferase n=2 Tax=unclassified Microbacterium TaxID=2609290 RepID=UPI0034501A66
MRHHPVSPIAELYPLMDTASLLELADSVRRNGLREPIVLTADGAVLDGRNRLRACEIAGVEPHFVEFAGADEDALEYVVDTNSARRHLSESQRALIAARLADFRHGGSRSRPTGRYTQKAAAAKLGIGERTVRDGKLVLERGPVELAEDVERGLIAVRAAAELIRSAGKERVLVAEYHRLRRQSGSVEWYSPPSILRLVTELFGEIDLDPASNEGEPWVSAKHHYTQSDDGLSRPWEGRVFLNPPWNAQGSPAAWVKKLLDEYEGGGVTEAVCLLPARTNTVWMDSLSKFPRCFVKGRLKFGDAAGEAPFPVVLVYLGPRTQDFVDLFDDLGSCYAKVSPSIPRDCPA